VKKLFLLAVLLPGIVLAADQAVLTWTGVSVDVNNNPVTGVTYNVYQGVKGATKVKVGNTSATTYTANLTQASGTTYCWQVSALTATNPESALSTEACKTFPAAQMATPTTLTVQ
jgi:hypothetical protein